MVTRHANGIKETSELLRVGQSNHWYGIEIGIPLPCVLVVCQIQAGPRFGQLGQFGPKGTGYQSSWVGFSHAEIFPKSNFPRPLN